jgi:hypothetical protein
VDTVSKMSLAGTAAGALLLASSIAPAQSPSPLPQPWQQPSGDPLRRLDERLGAIAREIAEFNKALREYSDAISVCNDERARRAEERMSVHRAILARAVRNGELPQAELDELDSRRERTAAEARLISRLCALDQRGLLPQSPGSAQAPLPPDRTTANPDSARGSEELVPSEQAPAPADVEDLDRIIDDPAAGLRSEGLAPSEPTPVTAEPPGPYTPSFDLDTYAEREPFKPEDLPPGSTELVFPASTIWGLKPSFGVRFGIGSVNIPGLLKDTGEPPRDDDPEERVTVRTYGARATFGRLRAMAYFGEGSETRSRSEGPDFRAENRVEVENAGTELELLLHAQLQSQVDPRSRIPRIHSRLSHGLTLWLTGTAELSRSEITDSISGGSGSSAFEFTAQDRLRDIAIGLGLRAEVSAPVASGLIFYAEGQVVPYVIWSNLRGVTTSNGVASEPFEESRSGIGVRGSAGAGFGYAISPGSEVRLGAVIVHRTRAGSFEAFGPDDGLPSGSTTHYGALFSAIFSF